MARRALCYGVSIQGAAALTSIGQCKNDALGMKDFLSQAQTGFDVISKIDPTAEEMRRSLFEVTHGCNATDQFLLYFSGHGRRGKNRKLYLCATDTDPDKLIISGLPFDQILEVIRESSLRSVLIILDCCYSGAAASSVLIKSSDDFLDEQTKEGFTDGWTILTSTTSVETTEVYEQDLMSPFTREFIASCKKLQTARNAWISVAEIYEELRFRLIHQRPTLFGQNPTFRVCPGQLKRADPAAHLGINFRVWDGAYFAFYGLLVLPYFRAWILLNPEKRRIDGAKKLSKNVDIIYNSKEIFESRVRKAQQDIQANAHSLNHLAAEIGSAITLLFPIGIEEVTYRRFSGSDRKYILHEREALRHRHYPLLSTRSLPSVTIEDTSWVVLETPEDYMREAFGVTLDYLRADNKSYTDNPIMILKEDSISRNAKYISIGRYTQQLISTSLIDIELVEKRTTVSILEGADERLDRVITARRKPSIRAGSFIEVQTSQQKEKKARKTEVACEKCMDEGKVSVEVNTRRYSVPCPECNWQESDQWKPFYDHPTSSESPSFLRRIQLGFHKKNKKT